MGASSKKTNMESFIIKTLRSLKKFPGKVAVKCKGKSTTYKELDEKSEKLASFFSNYMTLGSDKRVGVLLNKSEYLVVAMIGIFKSGHVYVPLDVNYPIARLKYMCGAANLDFILTTAIFSHLIPESFAAKSFFIEDIDKIGLKAKMSEKIPLRQSNQPVYIFFTSGTTGNPKGILAKDINISNYLNWCIDFFKRDEVNLYISCSSIGFDLSVMEIFYPLMTGKTVLLLDNSLFLGSTLKRIKEKVMLSTVPSVLNQLVLNKITFENVSDLILTGEKPNSVDLNWVIESNKDIKIWNLYGPTETTVIATVHLIEDGFDEGLISTGTPINNMKIKILDDNFNEVKSGSVGEIFIGGHGVASGYLEEKENKSFIELPKENNETYYRTGDLGWKDENNLFFLKGRKDSQFKKNGVRIEVSEIEFAASRNEKVRRAVLIVDEHKNLYLFVQKEIESLTEKELNDYLKDRILQPMLPQHIIFVEKFPVTLNGKADKHKLIENYTNEKAQ